MKKLWQTILILVFFSAQGLLAKTMLYSFNRQCKLATEIFTGRVVSLKVLKSTNFYETNFKTYRICFLADRVWKGNVTDTMYCTAWEFICAPNIFELGKSYLVYSTQDTIDLGAGRCGELGCSYVREDVRKLCVRYLFRRPGKYQSRVFQSVLIENTTFPNWPQRPVGPEYLSPARIDKRRKATICTL